MKTMTKILTTAAVFVVALSLAAPVGANCGAQSGLVSSNGPDGTSFIFSPVFANHPSFSYGYFGNGAPQVYDLAGNEAPRGLSPAADVTFWALGLGDPAPGFGNDNGAKNIIDAGLYTYGYGVGGGLYPAYSFFYGAQLNNNSNWEGATDGCIAAGACMCVLITDQDGDNGFFAITGGVANANLNTFLNIGGTSDVGGGNNAPIVLVPITGPTISSTVRDAGSNDLMVNVTVPALAGDYTQDGCNCAPMGFRILESSLSMGSLPPSDRDESGYTEPPLSDGSAQGVTPFGGTVSLRTECTASTNEVYLTTQLVFDTASAGGFDTLVVSGNSTRMECDPNLARPTNPQDNRPNRPGQDRPRGRKK
jgi:hypothetical protein